MTLQYPVIIIRNANVVEHLYNGHFGTSQFGVFLPFILSFTFILSKSQHIAT